MPPPVTLFRFKIEVSDVDRGLYESLDFRVAQHPSEALIYLVTRVLAFALSLEDGLAFSDGGLSDPDEAALKSAAPGGGLRSWIDIGNPSARRVHKAAKAAQTVKIYTYKNPELLLEDLNAQPIHRAEHIEIYALAPSFLDPLVAKLQRQNSWQIVRNDGSLMVSVDGQAFAGEIVRYRLKDLKA